VHSLTRGRGVDRPWRRPKVPPVTLTASTAGFAPRCASDFVLVEENRRYSLGCSIWEIYNLKHASRHFVLGCQLLARYRSIGVIGRLEGYMSALAITRRPTAE
jgi:hypothetical protein